MKIVASDAHRLHAPEFELGPGMFMPMFERPDRAAFVLDSVVSREIGPVVEPARFDDAATLAVHDETYLDFLKTAYAEFKALGLEGNPTACVWPRGQMRADSSDAILAKFGRFCFDGAVPITATTYEAVLASRDIALTAASLVRAGDRSAFALCRPPGHHAGPNYAGGYCYLNNAAIATQWLRTAGASRVAILDIDYHHGNGTQEIFYDRADVAVVSIHGDPSFEYPFYLGHADEQGRGPGQGYNLNLPLPKETDLTAWNGAYDRGVELIGNHNPDYLVVSMGMDTFENDPIATFKLKTQDYGVIGANIAALGLPTVFVFEGGYAVSELGDNAANLLSGYEDAI